MSWDDFLKNKIFKSLCCVARLIIFEVNDLKKWVKCICQQRYFHVKHLCSDLLHYELFNFCLTFTLNTWKSSNDKDDAWESSFEKKKANIKYCICDLQTFRQPSNKINGYIWMHSRIKQLPINKAVVVLVLFRKTT